MIGDTWYAHFGNNENEIKDPEANLNIIKNKEYEISGADINALERVFEKKNVVLDSKKRCYEIYTAEKDITVAVDKLSDVLGKKLKLQNLETKFIGNRWILKIYFDEKDK